MPYAEATIREVLSAVASQEVAPAGGTVAAVVGAMGAALCEMVYLQAPPETYPTRGDAGWQTLGEELRTSQEELLDLADADAAVVDQVFTDQTGEPRTTDRKRAVGVPLSIAEACADVIESGAVVTAATDRASITDAKTGVLLAHAALRAAILTVRANCSLSDDQQFIEETTRRVESLETEADETVAEILADASPHS